MTAREHHEFSPSLHYIRETQREGDRVDHTNFNMRELYGDLPESSPYRHMSGNDNDHRSIYLTSPFEHTARATAENAEEMQTDEAEHQRLLTETEERVESLLRRNPYDLSTVYRELDALSQIDGANIEKDLKHLNLAMHERGLLQGQELIRDDRSEGNGWGVVAVDKQNKERDGHRDGTMVSTSHAPEQSAELRGHYSNMRYRRGHYNGWQQSVEGGGGARGGFDRLAVGGHVPPGARRELIAEALRLGGVAVTDQNISAVNTIVTRESSWNPNITNHWDSNARAGRPSTGLMQTIPSTFRQYALPGLNNNIHDPLSNLVAGIRYAQARYGRDGISGVARVASRPGGY